MVKLFEELAGNLQHYSFGTYISYINCCFYSFSHFVFDKIVVIKMY